MSDTHATTAIWADHRRHGAEVTASYPPRYETATLAMPGLGLRPIFATIDSHRKLLRLAADERRRWTRAGF
jgi:hypothetical protein